MDKRTTPARPDLAARHLEGLVQAERFVEGVDYQCSAGVAPIRRAPAGDAMQEDQLLFGEVFTVYEERQGWGWGQSGRDQYVGYVAMEALSAPLLAPTHRIRALRTYCFSQPDLKSAPLFLLSMNAKVTAQEQRDRYIKIARAGWVFEGHLAALHEHAPDWVAEAERFLGAPYFWGGRESLGLDCSGLVQSALEAAGVLAPRDADMQEALGEALPLRLEELRRGDLVFWKGHVGIMLDGERLLHANA
ncbi:MAG: C40 family peptidase, partial [Hyphomonadaceae bacterium]|nr:C40 family peptidase [Hyphomonadaceae bacterium]